MTYRPEYPVGKNKLCNLCNVNLEIQTLTVSGNAEGKLSFAMLFAFNLEGQFFVMPKNLQ